MRILPEGFWYCYRMELEKFLKTPRSVLMGLIVPVIIAAAYLMTPWCFAFLIAPFLYSLYPAYRLSKPTDRLPFWFP